MLNHLDKLENSPVYYTRTEEEFEMLTTNENSGLKKGDVVKGGIYLLKNYRRELLNLPQLNSYNGENYLHKAYIKP